uniref:ATP synthase complex subunit 8 n=1 Tax=Glaresis sp. GLA01 TaxID=1205555 RepID=A0A0S2MR59_9SCAR|nr:ATP synthase F0 subunit 8 [Glaresis sp. GLA01]
MPQMAPLSWLTLFVIFTLTFLILNSLNYYNFIYTPKTQKFTVKPIKNNWKW